MKKNNFKSLMQAAVLVCTPLVIASCDDVFGDVDNPIPSHLTVSQAAVNLELHADRPDAATFIRKGIAATGAQLVYSSSDEKVATVDANGKITGVGEGECQIIVKATGLDSNGKQTYEEAEESFTVKVKDYRARVELVEGSEIPVFNSADAPADVDLSKLIKVWPANVNIDFNEAAASGVININTDPLTGQESISLTGLSGTAKVTAAIDPTEAKVNKKLFETYENKSFKDNQETEEFEITVNEGVAYIAGYDAKGTEIRKTIFLGDGAEEYTKLSTKLTGGNDVVLDAGWYYVDGDLTAFAKNIRVQGDVNIILNSNTVTNNLTLNNCVLMDESAKQNFKLNFYPEKVGAGAAAGAATFKEIKEFKEVNICGTTVTAPVNAVENVTINKGTIVGKMTGTGTGNVNITDGFADDVTKFAALTLTKVDKNIDPDVDDLTNIGTVTISEGTTANDLKGITNLTITKASVLSIGDDGAANKIENLTINRATSIGALNNVGTAVITETPIMNISSVTDLTLNKVKTTAARTLTEIGSVAINKTDGKVEFTGIQANALNISDGTIEVGTKGDLTDAVGQIAGFDKNGAAADTKVTMTGGKLAVYGPAGAKFAILGDVEVSGEFETGDFYAVSPDHHAVSGALTGKFEGCADNNSWKAITGAERPKYIRNKASE